MVWSYKKDEYRTNESILEGTWGRADFGVLDQIKDVLKKIRLIVLIIKGRVGKD